MIPLIASMVLFSIGIYGVLSKRDILRITISVSVILGSITLLLASLAQNSGNYSFILFIWAVEVMEILVALAVFLYLARSEKKDINDLQQLRW
jgi:NADH-quinone oxidoreductase subunit K